MTAESLLEAALELVESNSIRAWATSAHNKPLFLKIAEHAIEHKETISEPSLFCAFIVCQAIGL